MHSKGLCKLPIKFVAVSHGSPLRAKLSAPDPATKRWPSTFTSTSASASLRFRVKSSSPRYWRKLNTIATSATENEVKVALPGLTTPKERPFVLEGVVAIVRGEDKRSFKLRS